ncbi:membrane protein [Catenuloplanes niger JCM 9533]
MTRTAQPVSMAEKSLSPLWHVVVVLGLFVAIRGLQSAAIAWLALPGATVADSLLSWDAGWFVRVAGEGYPTGYTYDEDGTLVGNGIAFFPLYPALIRLVSFTGLSLPDAALAVTWACGAAASVALFQLGSRLYDRRTGYVLTVLVIAQPMSVVLNMGYSEGLFLALAAGALLAAHRRSWVWMGVLGLAGALARPTGFALTVALGVAALLAWRTEDRRGRITALGAAAVAMAGTPAYLLWAGHRIGDWDAWFRVQTAGWGSTFDFGRSTLSFLDSTLRTGNGWVQVSVAWILIGAVLLAVTAVLHRPWWPLVAYGLVTLVLVVGQGGYYHSKPRLLVPVLLIMLPLATALGRARWRTIVPALAGYAAFGLWYGAYLVTVWPYTI